VVASRCFKRSYRVIFVTFVFQYRPIFSIGYIKVVCLLDSEETFLQLSVEE
jgi:hypothetical protein